MFEIMNFPYVHLLTPMFFELASKFFGKFVDPSRSVYIHSEGTVNTICSFYGVC